MTQMPMRAVLITQNPTTLNMPVEHANTSGDATLASHSPRTQLTVDPPYSLLSLQLASKNPRWRRTTQDEYGKMLKDPEQEESVNRAFWFLERELEGSNWRRARDRGFREKQRTILKKAYGDPITQINLRLARMYACTRCSQEEFDEMKSKGGQAWDRMVEEFNQVVKDLHIQEEPSQDQASAIETSVQDTADGHLVLGSNACQATDLYPNSAQNTDGTSTIQAPSSCATNSATAESAVSKFYTKR